MSVVIRHRLIPLCLALGCLTIWAAEGGAQEDVPQSLEPVTVEGQRGPLDSRRPEYDRQLPCIGCQDAPNPVDNILLSVLRYVLLPSEPPDLRDVTPISLQQPRDPRAEKQP